MRNGIALQQFRTYAVSVFTLRLNILYAPIFILLTLRAHSDSQRTQIHKLSGFSTDFPDISPLPQLNSADQTPGSVLGRRLLKK
jgi:hypothetical protein